MSRIVRADVSIDALNHNYQLVKQLTHNSKVLAMVKANGYGHGLIPVAKALKADAFGVARLEEAVILADAGIQTPVVLMEGCFSQEELKTAVHYHFPIVVHSPYQVADLLKCKDLEHSPFKIWLKINTGMNRLGFTQPEFETAYATLKTKKNIEIIGFMTHFAQADEIEHPSTQEQYQKFNIIVGDKPGLRSTSNSAAILAWPDTHHDWVRPGLMLYGASPFIDKTGIALNLKPAMTLTTEIISVHYLQPGELVGYGGTYRCAGPRRVAVAAIGYGDGYPWSATEAPIWVEGARSKIVGRVSMDMITIDITDIPQANLGSKVELWGQNIPVEEVAKACKTLAYELFTRLTRRVKLEMV